jgi:hypothetical protein
MRGLRDIGTGSRDDVTFSRKPPSAQRPSLCGQRVTREAKQEDDKACQSLARDRTSTENDRGFLPRPELRRDPSLRSLREETRGARDTRALRHRLPGELAAAEIEEVTQEVRAQVTGLRAVAR